MLYLEDIIEYTYPLRLLYVEDNELARESTLGILEELFENIVVACDGEEGLEKFKNGGIDLIITDVNMPRLNGLDMVEKIRELDNSVSILVLSAYNESNFFIKSIKLGVDGYLLKPIDMGQFIGMLRKVNLKLKFQNEADTNLHLLHQYQEATDRSSIVSKSDLSGYITYVNDEFCRISGYLKEELIGKKHNMIRHPDNPESLYIEMWNTIQSKNVWKGIVRNINKNGESYYVNTTIKPILDKYGEIIEYISLRDDITDVMSPKKQLQDMVDSNEESVLVLLKIDRFDDIEKFYGYVMSQEIENRFSQYLVEDIPEHCDFDKVYILGDGEYAFAKDKASCRFEMSEVEDNLKEFQKSINDANLDVGDINYDISVVMSFAYGKNTLQNAKHGLKQILESKQDFIVASDIVQKEYAEAQKNLEVLKMIKKAIAESRVVSYYQPIINNRTKEIEKYESLVRIVDHNNKPIVPCLFLGIAKKAKYYSQITEIVLENSFNTLRHTDKDISINISILDIERRLTREKIFELLNANSEHIHRVVFELLEDEDIKDFSVISSFIKDVKSMGVRIAIDDFGTGYSNFERLLDYQPDILKIDGSLVKNIENSEFTVNLVETIVTFAKKQNILTIAEYVENENIFNILNEMGVDYSQGYYFGKPEVLK
jgi:PAS domain S-box-containing protein